MEDEASEVKTNESNDEDLTLLTDSMTSQSLSKQKDTIKEFTLTLRSHQDLFDYEKVLGRDDQKRKAFAIRDILLSRRIPFSTTKEQFFKNKEYEHELLKSPTYQPPPTQSTTTLPPVKSPSTRKISHESQRRALPLLRPKKEKKPPPQVTKVKVTTYTDLEQSKEDKDVNQRLQIVLSVLEQAKTEVNSTKLYVKAAKLFYDLKFYDRSIFCYQCATEQNRPDIIVDTLYLPNNLQLQRKLERMSDFHRKQYLIRREQLRQQYIYEESERQRIRARYAHCQLYYLYALIPSVQDLWKAFDNLQRAFSLCTNDDEHIELLHYFHYHIKALSDLMHGKPEYDASRQIIQGMAGPVSEMHLNILLELETLEPDNADVQEWLGIRYTEKTDFENAMIHYKLCRDLRMEKPTMQDVLDLWKMPVGDETYEDRERKERIQKNTNKQLYTEYNNKSAIDGDVKHAAALQVREQNLADSNDEYEKKDHTWFMGCHKEANTIIYVPPLQGWHVD